MLCGVDESDEGRAAVELGVELSERLGLRLVLAHVTEGYYPQETAEDGSETAALKRDRIGAARVLVRLAEEYGVTHTAECRSGAGERAALLGQIAAEEGADMILVGSRPRGWWGRGLQSTLAEELKAVTTAPILIAPPSSHRQR